MAETGVAAAADRSTGFVRELGTLDSTMIVAGSMIGSGIFIVPADIARQVGSSGWLIVAWVVTGLLTLAAALSYGELAAMMPKAGGQYVYLREAYSPLWGFLYGWTLFLVIQTGTIAAVAVGFSRFLGVLVPSISPTSWIVPPIDISSSYAVSLSTQQLVGILLIVLLTWINTRGIRLGKLIQNTFTAAKTLSLAALILVGLLIGRNSAAIAANFHDMWTPHAAVTILPGLPGLPALSAMLGGMGLLVAFCVAQVGSLFSSDAWNNITFTAGEVRDPRRSIPRSLLAGTAARHRALRARQRRLPRDPAAPRHPDRAGRPRGDRRSRGHLRAGGGDDDGDRDHRLDLRLQQRPHPRRRAGLLRDGQGRPLLPRAPDA